MKDQADSKRIQRLQKLLGIHKANLNDLLEQKASFGFHIPPHINRQIDFEEAEITKIQDELLELGVISAGSKHNLVRKYIDFLQSMLTALSTTIPLSRIGFPVPISLTDIYVELETQVITSYRGKVASLNQLSVPSFSSLPQTSLLNQVMSYSGMVILGPPGSGKSTSLNWISLKMLEMFKGVDETVEEQMLPVLVTAAGLSEILKDNSPLSLPDALSLYYQSEHNIPEDFSRIFQIFLKIGKVLILIDAVDDVSDISSLTSLIKYINAQYHWYKNKGNKFVVACRFSAYQYLPLPFGGMEHFIMAPLNINQIKEVLINWILVLENISFQKADEKAIQLTKHLLSIPELNQIASSPLLLTIWTILQSRDTTKYVRRTDILFNYFQTSARLAIRQADYSLNSNTEELRLQNIMDFLSIVAYWMKENLRTEINLPLIHQAITQSSYDGLLFDNIVNSLTSEQYEFKLSSIFSQKRSGSFIFSHKSYLDFFASQEFLRQWDSQTSRSKFLLEKANRAEWRDTIVFAITMLATRGQLDEAKSLIDKLFSESYEHMLVSAKCLVEIGRDVFDKAWWNDSILKLTATVESLSTPIQTRIEIANALSWLEDPRINKLEPQMVKIPAGNFKRGSSRQDIENAANEIKRIYKGEPETIDMLVSILETEYPLEEVFLDDFWVSKYPITNQQYKMFVDDTGHPDPNNDEPWAKPYNWINGHYPMGKANHPVVMVTWYDCQSYCQWLSNKTGIEFRLPTEAEWEKAARGINGQTYPWGNEWEFQKANALEERETLIPELTKWSESDSHPGSSKQNKGDDVEILLSAGTTPVGVYPEGNSPYGVSDMGGNCWEWTSDWFLPYADSHYQHKRFGTKYKVVKGSAWSSHYLYARTAYRGTYDPKHALFEDGFRIASSDSTCCIS